MPFVKLSIIPKACCHRVGWFLVTALTLAVALCLMSPAPASAQDLNPKDYFQLNYDPVSFDKTEINGSEVFHATTTGRAICTRDLPISVSEATITSQVVAIHAVSGTEVTLNSSYTVAIKPFPDRKGETFEIHQSIPLQFPSQAEQGDYNVIGKIVKAKVKVTFVWLNVARYFPRDQPMGSVKYIILEEIESPAPVPGVPATSPSITSPSASTPKPASPTTTAPANAPPTVPATKTTPVPPESTTAWWVELIIIVVIAIIILNIVWFLRHRTKKR